MYENEAVAADAVAFLLVPFSDHAVSAIIQRESGFAVSPRTVENWKGGRTLPPVEILDALAIAIQTPIEDVRNAYRRARFARRYAVADGKKEREPRKLKRLPQAALQQAS